MASSSCPHHFTSPTPHFFKIILPHILAHGKLEVPKRFVRKHEEVFQTEEVCLKVASGAEWKVGLTKSNEKVWFEKGWQEFVKFYSVEYGHFLTFSYEGNFCFHVIIFDQSASEIEYPIAFGEYDEEKVFDGKIRGFQILVKSEREEFEDNVNKRRREDKVVDKRMIKRSDEACVKMTICRAQDLKQVKQLRNEDRLHYSSELKATRQKQVCRANTSKSKQDQDMPSLAVDSPDLKPHKAKKLENVSTGTDQRARRMTEEASQFKSMITNPSFMVTMGPSYTGKGCLNIPVGFASMYLKEAKEIILQVSDGRVWKIWCGVRSSHSLKKFEMTSGWKAFVRGNSLKEGDICVFELIENTKITFKVTIFQSSF